MQISGHATSQDIISDISFLLGGGIDLNNFKIADRTRCVNERNRMVWQMIFESYGGWKFMDDAVSDASTGVPYADQTITSGTGLYALPTGALVVNGVFAKLTSDGSWTKLTPLTEEEFMQMGGDGHFSSNGTTLYYMLQGDVIRLLPTPNFTTASGLRVFFDQDISAFATTDTTKVPGFASIFHRMLSIGAALDYALSHGMTDKVNYLSALWNDYEKRLRDFYSKRFKARFPHRMSAGPDLVSEFM
jgi:hypothetical protein